MVLFSHSKLQCYEDCPKKYWFSYIEKPEVEWKEGIEAFMGKRVHETLRRLYTDLKYTKKDSLEELFEFYGKKWRGEWNESIVIVREGLEEKNYFELGKKCIENYYRKHQPFDSDKTIACEKYVKFPLDENSHYIMQGYIDRIAEEKQGNYVIHDYKTSGSLPLQEYLEKDRQLGLYSIAVQRDFPDCKEVNLRWHYLVFDKEFHSKRTEEQLEELKKEMIELIEGVKQAERENEFSPRRTGLCAWCIYRELCPEEKHLARLERMPAKEFKRDEGVKLVNRYVELEGKWKEARVDLEELKEEIFAYAEQFDLRRIAGSEVALKVWKDKGYSFSGLNEEQRKEVMGILEKAGVLEEFLQLNSMRLGKAIVKKEFGKELEGKLKEFGRERETRRVRLEKK